MKTIKFNPKETGWISIERDVETIVAYFEDGNKKTMSVFDFVAMKKREFNKIFKIDCYKKGEKIK